MTFHGKTCKIELFPEGSKPSFIQSCNHKEGLIKIAGLSAAAVAGAALFTGCSGQLMLPVRFSATVIGKDIQKALDTKQFSVVASLKPDAQENAINAFVRRQLPLSMYEVDFIERKTDTLDGKETDYLFVTLKNS